MPRLGSSLEGRSGGKRRSHPLGQSPAGNIDDDRSGDYDNDNDATSRCGGLSRGDDDEEERSRLLLLPGSSSSSANRLPSARRVHDAYADGASGCGGSGPSSQRWVAIAGLCLLGLILRNALVNVRSA